jgi:hypothetical protein
MYSISSVKKNKVTLGAHGTALSVKYAKVKYEAIVDGIHIQKGRRECKLKNGTLSFKIPKNTSGLKIIVENNLLFHPENCKNDFVNTAGVDRSSKEMALRQIIKQCNEITIDTSGLDHAPVKDGEADRVFGHQLGPHRTSRAMAMVHLAMFRAFEIAKSRSEITQMSALVHANYETLIHLYPSHTNRLTAVLNDQLSQMSQLSSSSSIDRGRRIGKEAAEAIISSRENDGSNHAEQVYGVDYISGGAFGEWVQDPISKHPLALGSLWHTVKPFVVPSSSFARCPPPPDHMSKEFMMMFDEVKSVGGDGITTPTTRSKEQEVQGLYWAYDGVPNLCAPPRLYNQIARQIANDQGISTVDLLKMLTLLNVAMADVAIVCWESKWLYKLWRPISAIRTCSPTGEPLQPGLVGDATWTPLGAPNSNTLKGNFTPPFPAYPSGHATFGAGIFRVLKHFFDDKVPFTFVSDELNGATRGSDGEVRPLVPRTFMSFDQAEEENGQSRMYLGIHFNTDKVEAIKMGHQVADYVLEHFE